MMKNKWLDKQEHDYRDFFFDLYGFRSSFDNLVDKDAVVLEIGCGNGYFLERLIKLSYTNLFGVDIVGGAARECDNKLFPNAQIREADGHMLPFSDQKFDVVVLSHVLEHSPLPHVMLKEIRRVLKESGIAFIEVPLEVDFTDISAHFVLWETKDDFDVFLRQNGWTILQSQQGYTELDGCEVTGKEKHYWVVVK